MIILALLATGWPLAPMDSTHALGNNWGEYQDYGGVPYLHPGIDVMGMTIGKPVYAVSSGVVKAWLTTQADYHWRLAIADYETSDSVEAWLYAHIDAQRYHKHVGDLVLEGELIGYLVAWPITGFDHCHFARIKDAGAVWNFPDWRFVQNPLVIISPYDDTTKPVFESAYGSDKFAFCSNNTSNYLSPESIYGAVDIVAKVFDETGLSLPYSEWERLIPYKIEYEIWGPAMMARTLSFIFHGVLDYEHNVDVIYKDDAICDTRGDYDTRQYYFIVTNTDGDSIVEASDAGCAWVTTDFPDGRYWVVVTAYDAAGNYKRDSMSVVVKNIIGIEERRSVVSRLTVMPNPNSGSFVIESATPVKIIDTSGRVVTIGQGQFRLTPGVYFAISENTVVPTKIVVVRK